MRWICKYLNYIREFGGELFIWSGLVNILGRMKMWKVQHSVEICKRKKVEKFLSKEFNIHEIMKEAVESVNFTRNQNGLNRIWVFWYQGIEKAPDIVKACIASIREYCTNYDVIVLDKDNIGEYYVPIEAIQEKLKDRYITLTHFSDILRMNLLDSYGGIWIDATIFLTGDVFKSKSFYTLKGYFDSWCVSEGKWTIFFMGGENPYLYRFLTIAFNKYWQKHDMQIAYFLTDHLIHMAYCINESIRKCIDSVERFDNDIYFLQHNLNNILDDETYYNFTKKTLVHKLTYKTELIENKDSVYNKYIKKYTRSEKR